MSNETPTPPRLVVVDVETNGLDVARHQIVEVAWWNLSTDERGDFVPWHRPGDVLANASLKALQVNHYVDRIADRAHTGTFSDVTRLYAQLDGATLVGSNVQFDAAMLRKLFASKLGGRNPAPWHHRLWEIGPYAAGILGLGYVPGLWDLTQHYGLTENDHTAAGDVDLTGRIFRMLRATSAPIYRRAAVAS